MASNPAVVNAQVLLQVQAVARHRLQLAVDAVLAKADALAVEAAMLRDGLMRRPMEAPLDVGSLGRQALELEVLLSQLTEQRGELQRLAGMLEHVHDG